MPWVELGNDSAIEGYKNPAAENPDETQFRKVEGERVTVFHIPEGTPLMSAMSDIVNAGPHLFAKNDDNAHGHELPTWVESDSEGLKSLLAEHYGLSTTHRPKTWGKALGIPDDETLPSVALYKANGHPTEKKTRASS